MTAESTQGKVLITGGSGFIGSRLARRLIDGGHQVRVLDLVVNPALADFTMRGDVSDPIAVRIALEGVDTVFHLAAQHRDDVQPIELYYTTNVDGMRVLCNEMDRAGIRRLIFTSSVAIYGFDTQDGDEGTPPAPANHYGKSKLEAERVVERWLERGDGREAVVMRPCAVFGPSNRGNIFNLFRQVISGRFIMVGDGRNRKSMAFVENVVDALLFVMARSGSLIVNYADKPDLCMNELVEIVCRAGGLRVPRLRLPKWLGLLAGHLLDFTARGMRRTFALSAVRVNKFCATSVVNADRIRALGFVPRATLAEGIGRTLKSEFPDVRVRKPRILLMNQTFWPDNVATAQHCHDLAKHLVSDGFDVTVIASRSLYGTHGSTLPIREHVDGILVERTGRTIFGNSGFLSRSLDFAGFTALALWRAILLPRFDAVICCTTPPFLGIAGIVLRSVRGGAVLLWMMDLYPEVPIAAGLMRENSFVCRFFRLIDRACLGRADAVVVLGERMRARVLRKGAAIRRLETIHVWADKDEIQPIASDQNGLRKQWGFGAELVLQYSGNFGLGHESDAMFRAMERLREERTVAWLFVGGGRKRAELDTFLRREGIRNVSVRPYQAREDLAQTLSVGDVHLVTIAKGFEGVLVPSKFYGALASGRPVLYIGPRDSEIADTIKELNCGFVFKCDDVEALVSTVRRLGENRSLVLELGHRARAGLVSSYSREDACRRWSALIGSLAATPRDLGDRDV